MMNGFGTHNWGMGWSWIIGIIFLIVIIWFVVRTINQNQNRNNYNPENKTALDIFKERYARGEISKKEFDEHKTDLI